MDILGSTLSFTPGGAAISTALEESAANTIDSSSRVMVVNGDNVKKVIYINDASDTKIASFSLPRFNSVTFIKKSTDKVYGQNFTGAGKGAATNLTFQRVHSRHAD
jgi:hypothetical protein